MKLIDILVQELPMRGGWPHGSTRCMQTDGQYVIFPDIGDHCDFVAKCMAEGPMIATREQYEAALAASKPEWDGEGLPPVGCRVEVKADDFEGGWLVIDVVYVHNGEVIGIALSENEYLNDRLEKFSSGYNRAEFRPIRSEEDSRRDATCDAMNKIWREVAGQTREDGSLIDIYSCIYDAIAAGKIPHIRID